VPQCDKVASLSHLCRIAQVLNTGSHEADRTREQAACPPCARQLRFPGNPTHRGRNSKRLIPSQAAPTDPRIEEPDIGPSARAFLPPRQLHRTAAPSHPHRTARPVACCGDRGVGRCWLPVTASMGGEHGCASRPCKRRGQPLQSTRGSVASGERAHVATPPACEIAPRRCPGACAFVGVAVHERPLSRPPGFAEKHEAAHARAPAHAPTLGEGRVAATQDGGACTRGIPFDSAPRSVERSESGRRSARLGPRLQETRMPRRKHPRAGMPKRLADAPVAWVRCALCCDRPSRQYS